MLFEVLGGLGLTLPLSTNKQSWGSVLSGFAKAVPRMYTVQAIPPPLLRTLCSLLVRPHVFGENEMKHAADSTLLERFFFSCDLLLADVCRNSTMRHGPEKPPWFRRMRRWAQHKLLNCIDLTHGLYRVPIDDTLGRGFIDGRKALFVTTTTTTFCKRPDQINQADGTTISRNNPILTIR
jgi:hypothetical protein